MPRDYYQRFADPKTVYVMMEMRTEQMDGRPGPPFHVRVTEEEYEELKARSRRQYERGQWIPGPYRPADDSAQYQRPYFDDDFFPRGPDPYANFEEELRKQQERQRKEREERARRARNQPPPTQAKSEKQLKDRLAELAGTVWIETMSLSAVYRKAQRRCHPDVGGNHELWIELEEIAHLLGIVKKKQPTR